jgi:hypothetical protein
VPLIKIAGGCILRILYPHLKIVALVPHTDKTLMKNPVCHCKSMERNGIIVAVLSTLLQNYE